MIGPTARRVQHYCPALRPSSPEYQNPYGPLPHSALTLLAGRGGRLPRRPSTQLCGPHVNQPKETCDEALIAAPLLLGRARRSLRRLAPRYLMTPLA